MSQGQVPPKGSPNQRWLGNAPRARAEAAPRASSRGKQLVGWLAALLALCGAVAALIFYPSRIPPPEFITLAVREYKSQHYRPNFLAVQDGELLARCFPKRSEDNPFHAQEGYAILKKLDELPKDRPVVVYLCALGCWADGQVYLLGGDANPDDKETWVPLGKVIDKLRGRTQQMLLLLDIMRPIASARLGILEDNIAEKTLAALAKEKDLPFSILCPCSKGQLSQVSEELGQSIFAYYIDQGLRGQADAYGPGSEHDGRIMLKELADFVTDKVDCWAWQNRGVRQTPVLLGSKVDFPLVQVDPDLEPAAAYVPPSSFPDWLFKGWEKRDKWHADLGEFGPGVLRRLEGFLLLAERRWRGGLEEARFKSKFKSDLDIEIDRIQVQVDRITKAPRMLPRSLAMIFPEKAELSPAEEAVRQLLGRVQEAPLKKEVLDEEIKKLTEKLLEVPPKPSAEEASRVPFESARAIIETAATTEKLGDVQLSLLDQLLQQLKAKPGLADKLKLAETVFMERLLAFLKEKEIPKDYWHKAPLQKAIVAVREAERLAAEIAQDPAILRWVIEPLNEADKERRLGETALFSGRPAQWPEADKRQQQALALYTDLKTKVRRYRDARKELNRALELLPTLGPYWAASGKENDLERKAWDGAVKASKALAETLAGTDLAGDSAAIVDNVATLRQNLDYLKGYVDAKVQRSLKLEKKPVSDDYWEIEAILESPTPSAADRQKLWQGSQHVAKSLASENGAKPCQPNSLGKDSVADWEKARKQWRTREAIDLLSLAGVAKAGELDKNFRAIEHKDDPDAWQMLAAKISKQLRVDNRGGKPDWGNIERQSRLLSPFDLKDYWTQNPTLDIYQTQRSGYLEWLSKRWEDEAASPTFGEGNSVRAFYTRVAEEYRAAARMK